MLLTATKSLQWAGRICVSLVIQLATGSMREKRREPFLWGVMAVLQVLTDDSLCFWV